MLEPIYRKKFQKDLQLAKKRGKDLSKLRAIMFNLLNQNPLDRKLLDHPLKGNYADCRECHIEPDWLLIYLPTKTSITFVRTGSHSDLFR